MAELPIPFPLNGISETTSYEAQPPGTTVDARNVRAFDGATGRARGAQREGMSRLSSDRLSGDGKVQAITTVTYDERQTTYTERTSAPAGNLMEWEKSVGDVRTLAVDLRGDVFAIEGNAKLVKYNSSGVKQYEFVLPVPTQNQVIRALTLDDLGNIYVACSEGTTGQAKAWIRSYYPNVDTVLALRWSVQVGGWTQRMEIINDTLYAAVNFPNTGRSKIIAYEFIFGGAPEVAREFSVPYPVNDLAINSIGEFITAHDAQTNRSYDPRDSLTTHVVDPENIRWDPTKLDNWEDRRWCWLSAESIPQQLGSESILDGDAITEWRDISGRDQVVLRPSTVTGDLAPKWISNGLAQRPTVRFEGDNYRLESAGSTGTNTSQDDAQKTLLPGTRGYAVVIVAKLSDDASKPENLLYQDNHWDPNDSPFEDTFTGVIGPSSNLEAGLAYCRFDHLVAVNAKKFVTTVSATCNGSVYSYSPGGSDWFRDLYLHDKVTAKSNDCGLTTGTSYWVRLKTSPEGVAVGLSAAAPSSGGVGTAVSASVGTVSLEITRHGTLEFDAGGICTMAEFAGNKSPEDAGYFPNGENNYAHTSQGRFDNSAGLAIISIVRDNEDCHADFSTSVLRVNGVPVSRWKSIKTGTRPGYKSVIGKMRTTDAYDALHMDVTTQLAGLTADISEIFVLRSYDDPADSKRKVCTFPGYNANAIGTNPVYDQASDTELERIEAYFAWKYGVAHLLDKGTQSANTAPTWNTTGGVSEYAHPYGLSTQPGCVQSPPNESDKGDDTKDKTLWTSSNAIMAKWNEQRGPRWAYAGFGLGYAVRSDGDNVWSVGPKDGNGKTVKLWDDAGASVTETAGAVVYAATNGLPSEYNYKYPITLVDRFGQFWVPSSWDSEIQHSSVRVYKAPTSGAVLQERLVYSTDGNDAKDGRAVAVDNVARNYDGNPTTIQLPEYFVVGTTEAGATGSATIQYCDPILATVDQNASSRIVVWLGVAGGVLRRFTNGVVQAVTGGSGFDPNAKLVQMVTAYQKVYITDGNIYKVYDPKTNTASEWLSGVSGRIPEGCRLMTFWRGRMVLARGPDDPFNWHMSASGDPDNWDLFPPDGPLETQAISGNNSEVGGNHDIINAIIPYDRERLIFGGDHTIHMMWGDPMAGGVITMLSDATGIAYGSGHAKDSQGILYFFGSRGGVYAISPGGAADRISNHPQKISSQTIDRRLEEVNFDTHYVTMAWDDVNQKLHVYQMPFALNTEQMEHWVWEKRTQSWWIDTFASLDLEPTAVFLMDGDEPDDRIIAVGCQDGYVRYPDRNATSDDGYPIDSYVVIGPLFTGTDKVRIRNPKINLSNDQGGCWLEMSSSDTADSIGDPVHRVRLLPGQNRRAMIGVRGAYCWLKLRSAANGFRWAYESGSVEAIPAGRRIAP